MSDHDQLPLDFTAPPPVIDEDVVYEADADGTRRPSIDERFAGFRAEHPEVMEYVRNLALSAVRAGRLRLGIAQLWEVARWNLWSAARENGYKLNNDFRAPAARYLMATEPELLDVFETRARPSGDEDE